MDIKDYISGYAQKADVYLKRLFESKKKEAAEIDPVAVRSLDILANYIAGGKRVRGALAVLGYELAGGKDFQKILPVSAAVEILHSSLLIHDDFIDRDELRRGKPTVHRIYAKGRGEHFGAAMAIVVADVGLFLSHQILAESAFKSRKVAQALSEFDRLLVNTGFGELLDIAFDYKRKLTWEDVQKVRLYKTAHYTFVMPMVVGAILGGASRKQLKAISRYGEPVGIAFQIRDDILGVFSDPNVTGKSNESDIREGKKTFLYLKTMELAGKRDKIYLKKWYGSKSLTKRNLREIRDIIEKSRAFELSQSLAADLVKQGKLEIKKITQKRRYQKILGEFADYMILRDK